MIQQRFWIWFWLQRKAIWKLHCKIRSSKWVLRIKHSKVIIQSNVHDNNCLFAFPKLWWLHVTILSKTLKDLILWKLISFANINLRMEYLDKSSFISTSNNLYNLVTFFIDSHHKSGIVERSRHLFLSSHISSCDKCDDECATDSAWSSIVNTIWSRSKDHLQLNHHLFS